MIIPAPILAYININCFTGQLDSNATILWDFDVNAVAWAVHTIVCDPMRLHDTVLRWEQFLMNCNTSIVCSTVIKTFIYNRMTSG